MIRHNFKFFDGSKPIAVLEFLANINQQFDENAITEGLAILLLPRLLEGEAKDTFLAYADTGICGLGGASTYPEAVQYLLRTFTKDSYIEEAVEELEALKQSPNETEAEFGGKRLRKQAHKCGNVFIDHTLRPRNSRGC